MHRCLRPLVFLAHSVLIGVFVGVMAVPRHALAQSDDQDFDQIEAEVHKQAPVVAPAQQQPKQESAAPNTKVDSLSDLSKLQSFSDVSVLQRRYLPKTGRFQLFAGLSSVMNDPWP